MAVKCCWGIMFVMLLSVMGTHCSSNELDLLCICISAPLFTQDTQLIDVFVIYPVQFSPQGCLRLECISAIVVSATPHAMSCWGVYGKAAFLMEPGFIKSTQLVKSCWNQDIINALWRSWMPRVSSLFIFKDCMLAVLCKGVYGRNL